MNRHGWTGPLVRSLAVAGLTALLAGGLALAANPVDETKPARADGEVEISLVSGELTVVGWDREEIRVSGELGSGDPEFRFEVEGDEAEIEVKPRQGTSMGTGSDLEVRIPAGSRLDLSGVSVEFSVKGVATALEVETVSGSVTVEQAPRDVEIEGVSGTIDIAGDTPVDRLEVEVISGNVDVNVPLAASTSVELESVSGDLTLRMPGGFAGALEVETFSGDIESDFGGAPEKTSKYTPARQLSVKLGSGSGSVDVETFSGRVRILKR